MPEVVIIGSGFAGAATAWALSRAGRADVLVLERDPAPGQQASGRNAGMVRTLVADPLVQTLCVESAALLAAPPPDLAEGPLFRRTGGVVLARGAGVAALRAAADRLRAAGREVLDEAPPSLARRLEGVRADAAFFVPDDGVADPHALNSAFLAAARRRGVTIRAGVAAEEVIDRRGRVAGVRTREGVVAARVVVNAAGAWAGAIPGAGALDVEPRRRHLFSTGPLPDADPSLPFVWHDTAGFYFRPESGGLLVSACDETPHPPAEPAVDPLERERLAARLLAEAPDLADLPIARSWACLRTFAPSGHPVIGGDPAIPGLFHVAALSGHGLTASAAIGLRAASLLLAALAH